MGASILFEPVDPEPQSIRCDAPSWFLEIMERAGMGLPCTLGEGSVRELRAMAATIRPDTDGSNPFKEIADLIGAHGSIRLWAQY